MGNLMQRTIKHRAERASIAEWARAIGAEPRDMTAGDRDVLVAAAEKGGHFGNGPHFRQEVGEILRRIQERKERRRSAQDAPKAGAAYRRVAVRPSASLGPSQTQSRAMG